MKMNILVPNKHRRGLKDLSFKSATNHILPVELNRPLAEAVKNGKFEVQIKKIYHYGKQKISIR
ncbi:MAG: hypothetical protein Q8N36_04985 [bacterium]|nr:hypothetical protein [bacterium]